MGSKRILITGVSRPSGIGATLAKRLALGGAAVALHGCTDYDKFSGYADHDAGGIEKIALEIKQAGGTAYALTPSDLLQPGAAEKVIQEASLYMGTLDGLIANHAYSTRAELGQWTAEHIDAHLLVNVRASMLLLQSFAAQADPADGGVVTIFTSGQYLGPMPDEIAYAVSKDALIGLCKQASAVLAGKRIRVNAVNPGPNDTGYLTGEAYAEVARHFPTGRWGTPEDAADLVEFLHSDKARWITGQVIASEGGFRRC